jgi:hypothetical protein
MHIKDAGAARCCGSALTGEDDTMASPYPIIGASIALAGADKLSGGRGYESLFHHLGWTEDQMHRLGAAELLGGLLMTARPTRRLGAAVVLAASAAVLLAELEKGDFKLAVSRAGVLLAALGGVIIP